MGFNLMSLFVEQTNTDAQQTPEVKKVQENKQTPAVTTTNTVTAVHEAPLENPVGINQEILDKLCAHMENCNLPGPDYMELKKAANSEGMLVIPDESVRFQAAFATLKSMHPNFTKDVVVNSIDEYIKELNKQNDIAKYQIETKRKSDVDDKKVEISNKEKKIAELQQEIVKISTEVSSMKAAVETADAECNRNIQEFAAAVNLIVSNLESDKKKIVEKLVG